MQAACDAAFKYAHQREAFGQKIGTFQVLAAVREACSCCKRRWRTCTRSSTPHERMSMSWRGPPMRASSLVRSRRLASKRAQDSAAVILNAAERSREVALDALQIHGGNGYMNDLPLGRFLRDAKLYEIGAGTSEVGHAESPLADPSLAHRSRTQQRVLQVIPLLGI